jgi:hypothetical protein
MLPRTGRKSECEELCKKRIFYEVLLGLKPTDFERCVKICRSFAA